MAFVTKEKIFSLKWFKAIILILSGTFIMAVAYVYFISPYKLAPGGVYGIAIVLHHIFGLPTGLSALAMDIPITLIGIKVLGPRFGWKTVLGFVSMALFVDLLSYFQGDVPLVEGDALLSAIFGGVLIGVGLGLVFKSKATSGGSDVIAMILNKYTRLPLGQLIIIVDSIIVLIGLVAFKDWKIPLYSWIVIYITGKVVDLILQGANYDKALFIISDKYDLIKSKILEDMARGGTILSGKGMYSEDNKQIIFTIVNRRELEILKEFIYEADPDAFVSVMNTHEILGEGFKPLKESVEKV
ncbi:MAG: YitT family protein [Bacteroidales bacterium]|nr:YitT family protein [Bacteroidales bacterium]MDD4217643.1 YitT family protein [Bacteroidales bacterium]MDY0142554.1 YitT family protein [Bacteroidales bacterium]